MHPSYPSAPRTAGKSPKNNNVTAGKFKPRVNEPRHHSDPHHQFQQECEEIFKKYFSEYEKNSRQQDIKNDEQKMAELVPVIQNAADEIFKRSKSYSAIKKNDRIALTRMALAALLAAMVISAAMSDQMMENPLINAAIAAGIGGLVAGQAGMMVGATSSVFDFAVAAKPGNKIKNESTKTLKEQAKTNSKILDLYQAEELTIPQENIFIATRNEGDWVMTLAGLKPLRQILGYSNFDSNSQFSKIKNSELASVVKSGDFESYKTLHLESVRRLQDKYDAIDVTFNDILIELEVDIVKKNKIKTTEDLEKTMVKKISDFTHVNKEVLTPLIKEAIKKFENSEYFILQEPGFLAELKHVLREPVFSHLKSEEVMRSTFESLGNIKDTDSKTRDGIINSFNSRNLATIRNEKYNDRIEKLQNFTASPESRLVIIDQNMNSPFHGRAHSDASTIIIHSTPQLESGKTITHEVLHRYDSLVCINDGLRTARSQEVIQNKFIRKMPCGDEIQRFENFGETLLNLYNHDKKNLPARKITQSENLAYLQRVTFLEENTSEIIPHLTDIFPPQRLMHLMPNVAVARSYTTVKKSPEARLYAAILQCDKDKVSEIIKEDPALLEKKYDGMTFNKIAQITVDSKYDEAVDPSIKTTGSSYAEINDLVKEKHQEFSSFKKYHGSNQGAEL